MQCVLKKKPHYCAHCSPYSNLMVLCASTETVTSTEIQCILLHQTQAKTSKEITLTSLIMSLYKTRTCTLLCTLFTVQ